MNLASYQEKIVNQVYDLLVNNDEMQYITLCGEKGSGKSSIAQGVAERLQEGWSIFFIQGVDPNLHPYLTWHIGTKLHTKTRLTCDGKLSFGVNFMPAPLSMNINGAMQNDKQNYVLTQSEHALLTSIKKQISTNENILFIADNYELWDVPSKLFLQKLLLPALSLLPTAHINAMLISHEKPEVQFSCLHTDISIPSINDDNMLFILHQKGYLSVTNTDNIRAFSGNDLSLALLAANYYDNKDITNKDYFQLLDNRCENLVSRGFSAHLILEPLSIINTFFTKTEAAFFMSESPGDEDELEFQAEENLLQAKRHDFIEGEESFHFSNSRIRDYFKAQIIKREGFLHRKFAKYLKRRHSEDYYNRGRHLKASALSGDTYILREAWQLLFLAYARFSAELGWESDNYNVIPEMISIIETMGGKHLVSEKDILHMFLHGYKAFSEHNYKLALQNLESISVLQLVPAFASERLRLMIFCYVQLADSLYLIEQTANELYSLINKTDFCEDEQYCRATLALLEVYSDRIIDEDKATYLKKTFIEILQRYPDSLIFDEFEACFNRKSAIYYAAPIAHLQSQKSVVFYRDHNNFLGLYMALCNQMANAVVCKDYDSAQQALNECSEILAEPVAKHYPSKYKIANNSILLSYLKDEMQYPLGDIRFITVVQRAQSEFSEIVLNSGEEVSHVAMLNCLGLSMLCNSDGWQEALKMANLKLKGADVFYQYFLHDLNFASAIIHGDTRAAKNELCLLGKLNVPLLKPYFRIFDARRSAQEQILELSAQGSYNSLSYHGAIVEACRHTQDLSCHFFGRGFLLSDLQFLSF